MAVKSVIVMKENENLYKFFKELDRSLFIENESSRALASLDHALPIEHGQTISQPSLVYSMTQWLDLSKTHKVLEIGTGTGYQTCFLSEFAGEVFTVELIEELSAKAQKRLESMGYKNIKYKVGDGSYGWKENAPYNRIIVTAAAGKIPEPLTNQLALEGKMIIPVGSRYHQQIALVTKDANGDIRKEYLTAVVFVELKGEFSP